ncbi:hypothetical protein PIB30_085089 [Stylosanthes scabra]|uniref:Uncharacterized protein n=1 Tax=Stylosanthes scabra TaxID=79078 RepID=A0ABU6XQX3_9FABA|nr:hypothetical protein [Stylosanthes scabra]
MDTELQNGEEVSYFAKPPVWIGDRFVVSFIFRVKVGFGQKYPIPMIALPDLRELEWIVQSILGWDPKPIAKAIPDPGGADGGVRGFTEGMDVDTEEDASDFNDIVRLTVEDISKMVYKSEERAYDFYTIFGRCNGFGVRKGDYAKDESGVVTRRRLFL